jgi:hypothetical protein
MAWKSIFVHPVNYIQTVTLICLGYPEAFDIFLSTYRLHAGRSHVRFSISSPHFLIDLILATALAFASTQHLIEMRTRNLPGKILWKKLSP